MKFELKSFRTMVARRIFTLFVICAVLPISGLGLVSYFHVRSQLLEQSKSDLRRETKDTAMSAYERLTLLRAEMRMSTYSLAPGPETPAGHGSKNVADVIRERFDGAVLIRSKGRAEPVLGELRKYPEISAPERRHLEGGKALLICRKGHNGSMPRIFMAVGLHGGEEGETLIGEIKASYLWAAAERRTSGIEVCVLDPRDGTVYFSTFSQIAQSLPQFLDKVRAGHSGTFQWRNGGKEFVGGYWTLFTEPNFFHPELLFLVFQSADQVFAPMKRFTRLFPAVLVLSLALVFFLSSSHIRRNLVPIEVLKEATWKIAGGTFGHRVEIRTGDEFEMLASSFNEMSTKLKESQDLLVKAAKMSTMGQMAGGVMHEVKQPLTAISGLLQLSLMKETDPYVKERLETAMTAVNRLSGILARFKSFSYMSGEGFRSTSLKEVLEEVSRLLEHQLSMMNIRCVIEHEVDLPDIMGDRHSLQQVFSNLLINAADALETKREGERIIRIRTSSREEGVEVEVEDNGCGIPPDIRKAIFDPFFTTKPPEKGTGLGMAIVESILHKHGAKIQLQSEVGIGTRFTITFPAPKAPSGKSHEAKGSTEEEYA
jgi:signal transduction histidine kinase